ncbi:hypothetical protein [Microcystis phage Mae-JY04]|uniref:hypothetical protein n=1 Tax=Blastomonas sp. TaxID=1909299 RepID=UPI00258F3153|nr:hypothetical protein [Blastomonas sp.]
MAKVSVRLLKPLNGREVGSVVEYDQSQIKRLVGLQAVEVIKAKAERPPLNKMEEPPLNKAGGAESSPPAGGGKPAEGKQKG